MKRQRPVLSVVVLASALVAGRGGNVVVEASLPAAARPPPPPPPPPPLQKPTTKISMKPEQQATSTTTPNRPPPPPPPPPRRKNEAEEQPEESSSLLSVVLGPETKEEDVKEQKKEDVAKSRNTSNISTPSGEQQQQQLGQSNNKKVTSHYQKDLVDKLNNDELTERLQALLQKSKQQPEHVKDISSTGAAAATATTTVIVDDDESGPQTKERGKDTSAELQPKEVRSIEKAAATATDSSSSSRLDNKIPHPPPMRDTRVGSPQQHRPLRQQEQQELPPPPPTGMIPQKLTTTTTTTTVPPPRPGIQPPQSQQQQHPQRMPPRRPQQATQRPQQQQQQQERIAPARPRQMPPQQQYQPKAPGRSQVPPQQVRIPFPQQRPQQQQQQRWQPPQQQQQQRRQPPFQQQARSYPRQPPRSKQIVAIKRFWTHIEKSLDGLADIEEAVSGRAQQLYQTAKETVIPPSKTADGDDITSDAGLLSSFDSGLQRLWSRPSKRSKQRQQQQAAPDVPPMDWSRFERKGQAAAVSATKQQQQKDSVSSSPYVYLGTSTVTTSATAASPQQMSTTSRTIDWDSLPSSGGRVTSRMIRANGGASTPPTGSSATTSTTTTTTTAFTSVPGGSDSSVTTSSGGQRRQPPTVTAQQQTQRRRSPFATMAASSTTIRPTEETRRPFIHDVEEEESSLMSRITSALPRPRLPSIRLKNPFRRGDILSDSYSTATLDAWKADDDDSRGSSSGGFLGLFGRARSKADMPTVATSKDAVDPNQIAAPLIDLMDRCSDGKKSSLLTTADQNQCTRIGRRQAVWDIAALVFFLIGCRQLPNFDQSLLPQSVLEVLTLTLPGIIRSLRAAVDTWAPFAFLAMFLAVETRQVLCAPAIASLIDSVDSSVRQEAQYGALFLRLFTAYSSSRKIPDALRSAAHSQAVALIDSTRLRTFVAFMVASLIWMSVSVLQELIGLVIGFVAHVVTLDVWKAWPPQSKNLIQEILSASKLFWQYVASVFATELSKIAEHPVRFMYLGSLATALVVVSLLPGLGSQRIDTAASSPPDTGEDEELDIQLQKLTEQISNLGASSATRLSLLSDNGGIDAALERWRAMTPKDVGGPKGPAMASVIQIVWRSILSGAILVLPLVVYGYAGFVAEPSGAIFRWDSLFDVAVLLLFAQTLVWKALSSTTLAKKSFQGPVSAFLSSLSTSVKERIEPLTAPPASLQLQASVSAAAGIVVRDLWAAHTAKRAWAVRGANFSCKNGEVLVILGDDSAGKSRLMTALSESIVLPPRSALTTTKARGVISVGGVDVTKWDNRQLRKRVGLLLNDVRTVSDLGQILSGLSLEEILEPTGGVRNFELSHNPGSSERACMMLALKVTGLYYSLLPQLPSKMTTVVTTNEEDTRSPLYQILSPAEWSRLLLARVIAQAVYDNESAAGTNHSVENSLMGSLLLLDDATAYLSEVEEARLLRELRKTGAATVVTSNRWASGRFADHIAVMKNGAVVETGTHAELLNRGPQQSIYAAKWHAMTNMQ